MARSGTRSLVISSSNNGYATTQSIASDTSLDWTQALQLPPSLPGVVAELLTILATPIHFFSPVHMHTPHVQLYQPHPLTIAYLIFILSTCSHSPDDDT